MLGSELRRKYLEFFEAKGCKAAAVGLFGPKRPDAFVYVGGHGAV